MRMILARQMVVRQAIPKQYKFSAKTILIHLATQPANKLFCKSYLVKKTPDGLSGVF